MKFSVITPSYNRGATIERAINSVLNQTYQEFEIIIVDDGSTDNTISILKKYTYDSRIKIIEVKKNGGVNIARNIGLNNVSNSTDWITFLDSDDEFLFDALENIKSTIERNSQINYFRFPIKYSDGNSYNNTVLFETIGNYRIYLENLHNYGDWVSVLNHSLLINYSFCFNEDISAFELITWLSLSKVQNVYYGSSIVLVCHIDNVSISRPINKSLSYYDNAIRGYTQIIDSYGEDLIINNKAVYVSYMFLLGYLNIITGNKKIGLIQTFKSMKYDFFNLRSLRNILYTFFHISK